jgi:O-antigen/teichoic acid export membrane protein
MLGLNKSVVRLMPEIARKDALINTLFLVVLASSFFIALTCVVVLPFLSPSIKVALESAETKLIFAATSMLWSICVLMDFVFIARRAGKYVLTKNALFVTVRTVAVFFLVAAGSTGILLSWSVGGVFTIAFSLALIYRAYGHRIHGGLLLSRKEFSKIANFSAWNYISDVLFSIPLTLSPLLILAMFGSTRAAEFTIALAVYFLAASIGTAFSNSLLAEGANAHELASLNHLTARAIRGAVALASIAFAALVMLGRQLLAVFSPEYATESYDIMLVLCLSAIPFSIFIINATNLNIRKMVVPMASLYGIYALFSVSAMIAMGLLYGATGVAEGILARQIAASVAAVSIRRLTIGRHAG